MKSDEAYETLDPQDWGEMRALAYRMVDDSIDPGLSIDDHTSF
jgi:hypothetical protein